MPVTKPSSPPADQQHDALVSLAKRIAAAELARVPVAELVALRRRLPRDARATLERAGDGATVLVVTREASTQDAAAWASLTPRERAVAKLIGHGLTNKEIGARLSISEGTVKDHVHHVLDKTRLRSRAAVAALAQKLHDANIADDRGARHPSNDRGRPRLRRQRK